jgi:hypothetical protein
MNIDAYDRKHAAMDLVSIASPVCPPVELAAHISTELNERFKGAGAFVVDACHMGFSNESPPPLNHIRVFLPGVMTSETFVELSGAIHDVHNRLSGTA